MNTHRTPVPPADGDVSVQPAARKRTAAGTRRAAPRKAAAGTKKKTAKKKVPAAGTKKAAAKMAPAKKPDPKKAVKKKVVKKKAATKKPDPKKAVKKKVVRKKAAATSASARTAAKKAVKQAVKKSVKKKATVREQAAVTRRKPATRQRPAAADAAGTPHPVAPEAAEREAQVSPAPDVPPSGPAEPREPAIPPLPEEDEEIVPYVDENASAAPAREAPAGAAPTAILDGIRRGTYHVSALGVLDDAQIAQLARDQGLPVREKERRRETLYRLLQEPPTPRRPQNVFVEGLLELHPDGYGFLRSPDRNYSQHPEDVYVAAGLIRKLGLKPGHWISGTARRSRPGESQLALHFVEEVNHEDVAALQDVIAFENLTVVFPDTRFLLEVQPEDLEMRVIDLFCPLGRGQRALIVSPPRAGKTVILQKLSDAIAHNSPDVDIVVLLVDERPEEVTNMRRSVRGEVVASTFDRPASNHIRIAELVMEKVKRMVENGRHVVLLLDSITRLGRAYNNMAGPSGRILTGGLEAKALTKPKRFFGAARNIEDGGSLTIVATALVETGSRMDDVIFEEFKGSGNMEIVLDRSMANARIWPAINLPASGTRNEDLLLHPEELRRVNLMRKAMAGQDPQGVMDGLREQMVQYRTNAELLMSIA